jgi:hypothetical protein
LLISVTSSSDREDTWRAEEIDEKEVAAVVVSKDLVPFDCVLVESLHHQEVDGHDPRELRLRPGVVLVLPPDDVNVRALCVAAQYA